MFGGITKLTEQVNTKPKIYLGMCECPKISGHMDKNHRICVKCGKKLDYFDPKEKKNE